MKFSVENFQMKRQKVAWFYFAAKIFYVASILSGALIFCGYAVAYTPCQDQKKAQDNVHSLAIPTRTHGVVDRPANFSGSVTLARPTPPAANASPAKVVFRAGLLTVDADNSDLTQILRTIAAVSGMTIDGSVGDVRVFGMYGPSNSREVLTELLRGLGYNFLMTGVTQEGAPRTLQLTARGAAIPASSNPAISAHSDTPEEHVEDRGQPGPGAILHVPPAAPDNTQDRMRQTLQRLQQMHDQQTPQNPPQ